MFTPYFANIFPSLFTPASICSTVAFEKFSLIVLSPLPSAR